MKEIILSLFASKKYINAIDIYGIYLSCFRSSDWKKISLENFVENIVQKKNCTVNRLMLNSQWFLLASEYKHQPMDDQRIRENRRILSGKLTRGYQYKHGLADDIFRISSQIVATGLGVTTQTTKNYMTQHEYLLCDLREAMYFP